MYSPTPAETIIHGGRIATLDRARPFVSALAIARGRVLAIGDLDRLAAHRTDTTVMIDVQGRTVIPGLNDSHMHIVREGLTYNMELRWDGVPSLAHALRMLRRQAERTPAPQWVRVVGGWSEFQFAERRFPTLDEINAVAPDTPVFVLHLYTHAMMNGAALRALGYARETPDPPGGVIERNDRGEPTGLLIATPSTAVLYRAIASAPVLDHSARLNSTRQFMRELNRLGITSASDAGGGGQRYPEDYEVIRELAARGESTVRIAYSLFTGNPGGELDDFKRWDRMTAFGDGDDRLKVNGIGEVIVYSAYDFENFVQPRPEIPEQGLKELRETLGWLVQHRWPFRLHATYDETVSRYLDVFAGAVRHSRHRASGNRSRRSWPACGTGSLTVPAHPPGPSPRRSPRQPGRPTAIPRSSRTASPGRSPTLPTPCRSGWSWEPRTTQPAVMRYSHRRYPCAMAARYRSRPRPPLKPP
jgi:predicted amidohydrolase YtcJ